MSQQPHSHSRRKSGGSGSSNNTRRAANASVVPRKDSTPTEDTVIGRLSMARSAASGATPATAPAPVAPTPRPVPMSPAVCVGTGTPHAGKNYLMNLMGPDAMPFQYAVIAIAHNLQSLGGVLEVLANIDPKSDIFVRFVALVDELFVKTRDTRLAFGKRNPTMAKLVNIPIDPRVMNNARTIQRIIHGLTDGNGNVDNDDDDNNDSADKVEPTVVSPPRRHRAHNPRATKRTKRAKNAKNAKNAKGTRPISTTPPTTDYLEQGRCGWCRVRQVGNKHRVSVGSFMCATRGGVHLCPACGVQFHRGATMQQAQKSVRKKRGEWYPGMPIDYEDLGSAPVPVHVRHPVDEADIDTDDSISMSVDMDTPERPPGRSPERAMADLCDEIGQRSADGDSAEKQHVPSKSKSPEPSPVVPLHEGATDATTIDSLTAPLPVSSPLATATAADKQAESSRLYARHVLMAKTAHEESGGSTGSGSNARKILASQ